MAVDDHEDETGARAPATGRRPVRSRARVTAGVIGLAVVLGAGAYTITDRLAEKSEPSPDVAAPAPALPGAGPEARADEVSPQPLVSFSAATPTPSLPASVAAKIRKAREDMAKHGVPVKHPPATRRPVTPVVGLTRITTGSLAKGGIVRLVSAHSDLTGQQELGWVAGGVTDYGDDKCSQTFKLDNSPEVQTKPNLLLCWRTSATKSVVAVVVDPKGHPSREKALAELDQKWQSMR